MTAHPDVVVVVVEVLVRDTAGPARNLLNNKLIIVTRESGRQVGGKATCQGQCYRDAFAETEHTWRTIRRIFCSHVSIMCRHHIAQCAAK